MSEEKKPRKKAESRKIEGSVDFVIKVRAAERGSAGSRVKGPARIRVFLADQKTLHPESERLVDMDFRGNHEFYNRLVRGFAPRVKRAKDLVVGPLARQQDQLQEQVEALFKARWGAKENKDTVKFDECDKKISELKKIQKGNWPLLDAERSALWEENKDQINELVDKKASAAIYAKELSGVQAKHGGSPIVSFSNYFGIQRNFLLAADKAYNLRSKLHLRGEDLKGVAPQDFLSYEKWDGSGCVWSWTNQTERHNAEPAAIFGGKSPLITIRPFEEEDLERFDLPLQFWNWIVSRRERGLADEWYVLLSSRIGAGKEKTWYGTVVRFATGSGRGPNATAGRNPAPSLLERLQASNYVSHVQYHRARVGNRLETHVNFAVNFTPIPNPSNQNVTVSFEVDEEPTLVLTTATAVKKIVLSQEQAFQRAIYAENKRKELANVISQNRKTAMKALQELKISPSLLWSRDQLPASRGGFRHVYHLFSREMTTSFGGDNARQHRNAVFALIRKLYDKPGPDGKENPYGGDHSGATLTIAIELQTRFQLDDEKAKAMAVVYLFVERLTHLVEWERGCIKTYSNTRKEWGRRLASELVREYNVAWVEPPTAGRKITEERKFAALSMFKPILKTAALRAGRVHTGFETKKAAKKRMLEKTI